MAWARRPPRLHPRVVLALAGLSVASSLVALASRQFYRRLALSVMAGAGAGAALTYYNGTLHSLECSPAAQPLGSSHVTSSNTLVSYRPPFESIKAKIYSHLTEDYENRGQLDLGEESITVRDHVFAQIGVIDEQGVRNMWRTVTLDVNQMPKHGLFSQDGASIRHEPLVFCDIGSGVGNVCLQILAETPCSTVVGVEVIPSRHRAAVQALDNGRKMFPDVFHEGKTAHFLLQDFVGCADTLNKLGVTVVFSHSWMFDDDLMVKFTELIQKMPQVKIVVTSRPLSLPHLHGSPLKFHKQVHFSADWNEAAPFHLYYQDYSH